MNEVYETDVGHGERIRDEHVDWAAVCRLALVVSVVAAFAVLGLSRLVGETTLILSVIVIATATSWFHLEHGHLSRPAPDPARLVRHDWVRHD